ncbi:hypothetical protein GQ457_17G010760 [Hibiscus cannabinus]
MAASDEHSTGVGTVTNRVGFARLYASSPDLATVTQTKAEDRRNHKRAWGFLAKASNDSPRRTAARFREWRTRSNSPNIGQHKDTDGASHGLTVKQIGDESSEGGGGFLRTLEFLSLSNTIRMGNFQ